MKSQYSTLQYNSNWLLRLRISVSQTLSQRNKFANNRHGPQFNFGWYERAVVQYLRKETSQSSPFQFLSDSLNCTHALLQRIIDKSSCLRLSSNEEMVELTEVGRTQFLSIRRAIFYVLFHHSTRSKPLDHQTIMKVIETKTLKPKIQLTNIQSVLRGSRLNLVRIGIAVHLYRKKFASSDQDNPWMLADEVDDYRPNRYSVALTLSSLGCQKRPYIAFPPDVSVVFPPLPPPPPPPPPPPRPRSTQRRNSPSTTSTFPTPLPILPTTLLSKEEILRRQSLFHELSSTLMTNDDYVIMVRIIVDFGGLDREQRQEGHSEESGRDSGMGAKGEVVAIEVMGAISPSSIKQLSNLPRHRRSVVDHKTIRILGNGIRN